MNIFNFFKKKYSIEELRESIDKYISRLENIITVIPVEVEKIKNTPLGELPETLKSNINSLEDIRLETKKALDTVDLLTNVKNQEKKFKNVVRETVKNLGALQAVVEMELMDANSYIKTVNLFYNDFESFLSKINLLVQKTPAFTEDLRILKKKSKSVIQESKDGIDKYISKLENSSSSIIKTVDKIKVLTQNTLHEEEKNAVNLLQNLEIKIKKARDSANLLLSIKNQHQEFEKEIQQAMENFETLNTVIEPIFMRKGDAWETLEKSYEYLPLLLEFGDLVRQMPAVRWKLTILK